MYIYKYLFIYILFIYLYTGMRKVVMREPFRDELYDYVWSPGALVHCGRRGQLVRSMNNLKLVVAKTARIAARSLLDALSGLCAGFDEHH